MVSWTYSSALARTTRRRRRARPNVTRRSRRGPGRPNESRPRHVIARCPATRARVRRPDDLPRLVLFLGPTPPRAGVAAVVVQHVANLVDELRRLEAVGIERFQLD